MKNRLKKRLTKGNILNEVVVLKETLETFIENHGEIFDEIHEERSEQYDSEEGTEFTFETHNDWVHQKIREEVNSSKSAKKIFREWKTMNEREWEVVAFVDKHLQPIDPHEYDHWISSLNLKEATRDLEWLKEEIIH